MYYELTNETATKYVNVTITDKTDGNLTLKYWGELNGSVVDLGERWQHENRSDLNFTGFKTYLWVTDFDLQLQFGWSNYTKVAELTDAVKYANATRTLYYDLDKGWLEEADYASGAHAELVDTGYESGLTIPPDSPPSCGVEEEDTEEDGDETVSAHSYVCERSSGSDGCDFGWESVVHIKWPTWHLFQYSYLIEKNDNILDDDDDWDPGLLGNTPDLVPHATKRYGDSLEPVSSGETLSTRAHIRNEDSRYSLEYYWDEAETDASWTC